MIRRRFDHLMQDVMRILLTDKLPQGIRFHGMTILECQSQLPAAPGGKEIIAESMLWLLLTGKVPTVAETRQLSCELAEKGELPEYAEELVDSWVTFVIIAFSASE